MNDIRRIERMIAGCPEKTGSSAESLPPVPEEDFFDMEQRMKEEPEAVHLFPYVRKSENGEYFIDIYVCDEAEYPLVYSRYVIREGYCFTEEDEDRYLEAVSDSTVKAPSDMMEHLFDTVDKVFPQWHFRKYSRDELGAALKNIYFVSHRNGCREILYKAGLDNIATNLENISEYDISGSTPERIIGHGVPLKLLKIFNRSQLLDKLFNADSLEWYADVYNEYSAYITDTEMSVGQWCYLERLYDGRGFFAGRPFNRALYRKLKEASRSFIVDEYRMFYELKEEADEFRSLRLPGVSNVTRVVSEMEHMLHYIRNDGKMDERLLRRKKDTDLEYKGRDYSILMPGSTKAFFREAVAQGNCVMSYVAPHAEGATNVLFLRRNSDMGTPYVTIEVCRSNIIQVFGRFNRIPDVEVLVFVEEYARKKRIYYDPEFIIRKCLGMEDDPELELEYDEDGEIVIDDAFNGIYKAYVDDFKKRMCWPSFCPEEDEKEYRQLEFEDCFPKVA